MKELPAPAGVHPRRIYWPYTVPIVGIHALALLALHPYFFSWTAVIVFVAAELFFGKLGINLTYHRLLSHRSFKVPTWFERCLATIGVLCLQDTPTRWVAVHRRHHAHPDTERDPHSPLVAFLWGHVGWLLFINRETLSRDSFRKYGRDILEDRYYMALEKHRYLQLWIWLAHAVLFFVAGYLFGGLPLAWGLLVWGVFVRTVVVWHFSWSVNSFTHLFGYRSFETGENSRNNPVVGILVAGEGWHNNHHHDPRAASTQRRWWEFDLTYYTIKLLYWIGLAKDVVPQRETRNTASADVGDAATMRE